MQWDQLLATKSDGDVDWGLLLTTLFWNLNYWDSVSTMASEVKNPARTFPRALVLAMVFTVGMYFLVLGVAIGNAPGGAQHEWNNSELASAGLWVAGDWLRIWIVASVTISAIGLFLAEMSSDIYQLDGMADMGMIPQLFRLKNRYGVPVVALLLQASIILVIVQCIDTLEDIISLEMISYCFAQLLEFAAFARLRWTHPDAVRPYKVPGGKWASVAIIVPGSILTGFIMAFAEWQVWVAGGGQILLTYLVTRFFMWSRVRWPQWFRGSHFHISLCLRLLIASRAPFPQRRRYWPMTWYSSARLHWRYTRQTSVVIVAVLRSMHRHSH
eukprot:m.454303 g.454303  ORF g.454303 m.454303 type:complete len:328 (+) comp21567_c0_seq4:949-1932(+)